MEIAKYYEYMETITGKQIRGYNRLKNMAVDCNKAISHLKEIRPYVNESTWSNYDGEIERLMGLIDNHRLMIVDLCNVLVSDWSNEQENNTDHGDK